jgi:tyrosyl-tRNA synthetase
LDPETIRGLFGSASTVLIPRNSIQTVGELAEKIRPGGAKKMKEGALRINGVKMQNPDQMLELPHILIQNQFSLACWGKRKFSLIVWT